MTPNPARSQTVDQSKAGEIRDYAFSPDGKWLAYSRAPVPDGRVWAYGRTRLYLTRTGKELPVSNGFTDDKKPRLGSIAEVHSTFISKPLDRPHRDQLRMELRPDETSKPASVLAADGKSPFLPDELKTQRTKKKAKKSGEKAGTAGAKDEDKDEDAGDDAESKIESP